MICANPDLVVERDGQEVTLRPTTAVTARPLDAEDPEKLTEVGFLGMLRNEETLEAVTYANRLPDDLSGRQCYVIDPMLATGSSMVATIDLLKKAGCRDIRAMVLVAAPEGIAAVEKAHPDVQIYTASIDERLNEHGYIIPGLGDAGDKIFGTKQKDA